MRISTVQKIIYKNSTKFTSHEPTSNLFQRFILKVNSRGSTNINSIKNKKQSESQRISNLFSGCIGAGIFFIVNRFNQINYYSIHSIKQQMQVFFFCYIACSLSESEFQSKQEGSFISSIYLFFNYSLGFGRFSLIF
eukprot:TRINITY_DN16441_c0_g1_i1.p2 TRINITY_DN16441_c0_g1~~TRINITY_DN16441_c0_g1_i1.p2  ORF type:complete len:137 (+),score=5.49 TRINITY_DN16441_c0_g1_i1:412-822(+)